MYQMLIELRKKKNDSALYLFSASQKSIQLLAVTPRTPSTGLFSAGSNWSGTNVTSPSPLMNRVRE